jgi:hypothetical protein
MIGSKLRAEVHVSRCDCTMVTRTANSNPAKPLMYAVDCQWLAPINIAPFEMITADAAIADDEADRQVLLLEKLDCAALDVACGFCLRG